MCKTVFHTCRVSALVCLVTKKLVRLTKYAKQELNNSSQTIVKSFLASSIVMPTTLSSIKIVAGSKKRTAIGAMYKSRFIELSFSLIRKENTNEKTKEIYEFKTICKKQVTHIKNKGKWRILPLRRQKNPLQHCLQCPCSSGSNAHDESKEMKARLTL
jgi:hypothetical protein